VENVPVSETIDESLRDVLERDHRDVDDAVEGYADGTAAGTLAKLGLKRAEEEKRRHIYAEEELLFPPLRRAGMVGPILVMLREHGQMWPILDTLDRELRDHPSDDVLRTACRELLTLLQQHNPKEEQILYPQVDQVLGADEGIAVREFLDAGHVPADWTCQHLQRPRSAPGRTVGTTTTPAGDIQPARVASEEESTS
jgi:iron-sulfur cluster repair protein YtfE (RIC family)